MSTIARAPTPAQRAGSEARSLEVGADLSSSSCDASTCVANSASASSHAPHPGCRLTRSARAPTRSSSTTEGRCCASNARGAEASTARAWRWWTETRAWCRPTPGRRPRRLPLRAARTPAASGVLRGHARGGDRREARGVREKGGQAAGGHGVQARGRGQEARHRRRGLENRGAGPGAQGGGAPGGRGGRGRWPEGARGP